MSTTLFWPLAAVLFAGAGGVSFVRAADETSPPPPRKPWREDLREHLKNLTPVERQILRELREKSAGPPGPLLERRLAEVARLPPEERLARLREWQRNGLTKLPLPRPLPPEEFAARRQQLRARLDRQISELQQRKSGGQFTAEEQRHLDRLREVAETFGKKPPGLRRFSPPRPGSEPAKPDDAKL